MEKIQTLKNVLIIVVTIMLSATLNAQKDYVIRGEVIDENNQELCFATIALRNASDSSIIAGTMSDGNGRFEIKNNSLGNYLIIASFVGYNPAGLIVNVQELQDLDIGKLKLRSNNIVLKEIIVSKERVKARQKLDNTTYYVNTKIQSASSTGMDVIKYIPGVQVDLFNNISLEGSQNLIIQVNGIKRDAGFVSQLNSDEINKIEVNSNPGVKYGSEYSGMINIITKKIKNKGLSGHIYTELPTRYNEVYSFPGASINYSFNNATLFASYSGEYSFFDIEAEGLKKILTENNPVEISNRQYIQQKNWSHKFHYGADFSINSSNQFNFYGFINPYSNEHDGLVTLKDQVDNSEAGLSQYNKDDLDKNHSFFTSLFYKHLFNDSEKELTFDINYYQLRAQNQTTYSDAGSNFLQISNSEPYQNSLNTRLHFSAALNANIKLETGVKHSFSFFGDAVFSSFKYRQQVLAPYSLFTYSKNDVQVNGGMRAEVNILNTNYKTNKTTLSILPIVNIKYDFSEESNLKLAYRKQIIRPNIYQLNPNINIIDPYTTQKGNPDLSPEITHRVSLDYSTAIQNSFISAGVFYNHSSNVIEKLTVLNDSMIFEKETQNLGNSMHFGMKILGSFKFYDRITLVPLIKFYQISNHGNEIASVNAISNTTSFALETGLSMIFSFKNDIALSANIKYNSPVSRMQTQYYEDGLYFVSLEKLFFNKLKVGVTSAVPFKKSFTYQGYKTKGDSFYENSEADIKLSMFPVWIKIKYNFSSGRKVKRINRENDFEDYKVKKGF